MRNWICACVIVAASILASPGRAAVIVDTFGPGNSFDNSEESGVYAIGFNADPDFPETIVAAAGFTLTADGIVDDVAVAADAHNYSLVIFGDNGGLPDGNVLGTVSSGFTFDGYIEFTPSIALAAGDYWLVMAAPPGTPIALGGWYPSDQLLLTGPFRQSGDAGQTWAFGGAISSLPAFRIGATQTMIPEPGTMTLIGAGFLGLVAFRRRPA